jgi:hypothetical protein
MYTSEWGYKEFYNVMGIQSLLHIPGMTGGFALLSFPLFDYINGFWKFPVMLIIRVDVSVL